MRLKPRMVSSTVAFILYSTLLGGGFVFATYNPTAPYLAFSSQITIGFGAYIARRYFNNKLYEGKNIAGND